MLPVQSQTLSFKCKCVSKRNRDAKESVKRDALSLIDQSNTNKRVLKRQQYKEIAARCGRKYFLSSNSRSDINKVNSGVERIDAV